MSNANSKCRILCIDDNPSIHQDFKKVLCATAAPAALQSLEAALFDDAKTENAPRQMEFEIDSALQGQEGVEKLKAALAAGQSYPLAFVDMRMPPGWDGVQTIRELWKVDKRLHVVICTAYSDYSPEQISKELGISHQMMILRKPFEAVEIRQLAVTLCEKWQTRYQRNELEKEVEERTAELKRAALHDQLTGLPNRLLFNDRLCTALRRAKREKDYRFAVLFADCDRFKIINDSLGHSAGDQLLLEIARRLQNCVRDVDTICAAEDQQIAARFGGDEFCIILDHIRDDSDAARVAKRILDAMAKPYMLAGRDMHCSISIGITTSSLDYNSAQDMLRDADIAMYRAKKSGGSTFVMFDQKMHADAVKVLNIENELRRAISRNEITLHYQPIIDMRSNRLLGFEALCRWNHPERGLIPPCEFVPQAEQNGVIVQLGIHVLEIACEQLVLWQKEFPDQPNLTMSVNVSRKQLDSPDLTRQLARVIERSGINPRNLKLEITESTVSEDNTHALQVLQTIQDMKVQLHMDDFGTGYSSLSAVHNMPLDGLKIDKQFVEAVGSPDSAAVIRSVVSLAHNLNVPLVAEGIETPEQHAALAAMGCDHAQGYLFAKPMAASDAEAFIRDHGRAKKTTAA